MNTGSSIFMAVGSLFFLILFGLPLFLCPLAWAKRVGWKVPAEKDLAVYLGRSLGAVILAIIIMAVLAAVDPWKYRFVFDMVIFIGIFQVIVHAYGFFKKTQPLIEHLEIIMYAGLSLLTWIFYPVMPA